MQVLLLQNIFTQELDYYHYHLKQGKNHYNDSIFGDALVEFILAQNYIPSNDTSKKNDIISIKISETIDAMNRQKKEREDAIYEADKEKEKADSAKFETQQSLAKTQKIINAFYFYKDQFAFAYKNNKFGFINKDGDVMVDYKYEILSPFDHHTGLSYAYLNGENYIIDDKSKEYLCTFSLEGPYSAQALNISNGQLSTFPLEEIIKFHDLKILLINGNKIQRIPTDIDKLSKLRKLFIYGNSLNSLPDKIDSLSGLVTLDVSDNNLLHLPGSIGCLKNLEELILFDNNLNNLPKEIGNLDNLLYLDVSQNFLDSLPVGFDSLKSLRILALEENQFKIFPPELEGLTQLLMLDLSGNYIDSIPPWIQNMHSLTNFQVWNNQLVKFPKEIVKLANLKVLVAGNNKVVSLPANMDSLNELEELVLYRNQLDTIPPELGKMKKLRKLDLRRNPDLDPGNVLTVFKKANKQIIITSSEAHIVDTNELLINVDLEQVLVPLLSLDTAQTWKFEIDLSKKNLDSIPAYVFTHRNLISLNLSDNNITTLIDEILCLTNLKSLYLTNNPIQNPEEVERIKAMLPECEVYY